MGLKEFGFSKTDCLANKFLKGMVKYLIWELEISDSGLLNWVLPDGNGLGLIPKVKEESCWNSGLGLLAGMVWGWYPSV